MWFPNNSLVWERLEQDIIRFRQQGVVIVLGDFNSRVGESIPLIATNRVLVRRNNDMEVNSNGREFMSVMRVCDMVITT